MYCVPVVGLCTVMSTCSACFPAMVSRLMPVYVYLLPSEFVPLSPTLGGGGLLEVCFGVGSTITANPVAPSVSAEVTFPLSAAKLAASTDWTFASAVHVPGSEIWPRPGSLTGVCELLDDPDDEELPVLEAVASAPRGAPAR